MRTLGMNIDEVVEITMTSGQKIAGRVSAIGENAIVIIRQKLVLKSDKNKISGKETDKTPVVFYFHPGYEANPKVVEELIYLNQTVDAKGDEDKQDKTYINPAYIETWRYKKFQEILKAYICFKDIGKESCSIEFSSSDAKQIKDEDHITYYDDNGTPK